MPLTPYYDHAGITIYHGDCREILPQLEKADLVLTDPPYGIKRDQGMGGGGYGWAGKRRYPKKYFGDWDGDRPDAGTFALLLSKGQQSIIWGGSYFADMLPSSTKWLVWDKEQVMPSYSDCELAWTSLPGNAIRMFRYCGSGVLAKERERVHPTQKPLALMQWCISLADDPKTILDPYLGSGTALRAAKNLGLSATGIEKEERYCEISAIRMEQEILDIPINGHVSGSHDVYDDIVEMPTPLSANSPVKRYACLLENVSTHSLLDMILPEEPEIII